MMFYRSYTLVETAGTFYLLQACMQGIFSRRILVENVPDSYSGSFF